MTNIREATIHKRVNITLPEGTLKLLDRVSDDGNRSAFINHAVRFYVKKVGQSNLKSQLRRGAIARASRDAAIAEEWFHIDNEA